MERLPNIDLGKTQITDKIRVSSAAIFYEFWGGDYYQLETFIFSDDPSQKTRMIIHGTTGREVSEIRKQEVYKVHKYIADNLIKKFNKINNVNS